MFLVLTLQRLVTPARMQHKRRRLALKRRQQEKVKDAAVSLFLNHTQFFSTELRMKRKKSSKVLYCNVRAIANGLL